MISKNIIQKYLKKMQVVGLRKKLSDLNIEWLKIKVPNILQDRED